MPTVPPPAPRAVPVIGHSLALLRHRHEFLRFARDTGPVATIRLGPRKAYLINDLELVRQVLTTDAAQYGKGELFARLRPYFGNGLSLADGREHRKHRRIIRPAFHRTMIERYVQTLTAMVDDHLGTWQNGEQRQLLNEFYELSLTFAGRVFFSADLGRPVMEALRRSLPDLIGGLFLRVVSPASRLERLPLAANRRFEEAIGRIRAVFNRLLQEHRSSHNEYTDLLSMLLDARDADTGEPLSDEQIRAELLSATLASTVTTASALGWCCRLLSAQPEVQTRVQEEVDTVLDGRLCTLSVMPELQYTSRVIKEAMRLYPPVHFLTRSPRADVELGGYHLPAGCTVLFSFYALHRDRAHFPDPDRFDPDRWLDSSLDRANPDAYLPFGAGMHGCIGEPLARAEMLLVLSGVAARWRLSPVNTREPAPAGGAVLGPGPVPVVVHARTPRHPSAAAIGRQSTQP